MSAVRQKKQSPSNGQNEDGAVQQMEPCADLLSYAKQYAREKPDVAALWCFGIGFVLGWKVKPW